MKIKTFSYSNNVTGWKLHETSFGNFSLLVGISGVGKTKILRALLDIKSVAEGKCKNGISWSISFETSSKREYTWSGEFEATKDVFYDLDFDLDSDEQDKPKVKTEKLLLNGEEIIFRTGNKLKFNGKELPKLSKSESVISILKEEESIKPIIQGFKRVIFNDQVRGIGFFSDSMVKINQLSKKYDSADKIIDSDLATVMKLTLAYLQDKVLFDGVKNKYLELFPCVEDIKIAPLESERLILREVPVLQIKERNVDKWIPFFEMSSGMLRSLNLISQALLSPQGTVILLDEFENSLGINCINLLTDEIFQNCHKIQFIMTSHHPYIINSISIENWKIIRRNRGDVSATEIKDIPNWPKSKHDAFIKLVNLPEYEAGVQCE